MTTEKLSIITAKLPKDMRDQFAELAKRRNLTPLEAAAFPRRRRAGGSA
jgi:hypothetical protein